MSKAGKPYRRSMRMGVCARAFGQMRRDPWLESTAVLSLSVLLCIMGAYLALCINFNRLMNSLDTGVTVSLVLNDDLARADIHKLAGKIRRSHKVTRVRLITRDEALMRLRAGLGDNAGLLQGLESNPLPRTLEISLSPGFGHSTLEKGLSGLSGVQEVIAVSPWLRKLEGIKLLFRDGAMVIGMLLFLSVIFLSANTVRLAVYSRRQQLEILDLLGASIGFIRRPFLLEAAMQGLIASVLASLLLWGLFSLIHFPEVRIFGIDPRPLFFFSWPVPLILGSAAVAACIIGGFLGVGRALKVRGL